MPVPYAEKDRALIHGRVGFGYDDTDVWPLRARTTEVSASAGVLGVELTPVKTIQTELLAITNVAASVQQISSILALTGIRKVAIFIDHGRASTAAFSVQGPEYGVEASQRSAGNDTWVTIASFVAGSAAALSIAPTGSAAVGAVTINTTSATTLTAGDHIFWNNSAAATASEWAKVAAVQAGTSITLLDGLTRAQSATVIYNKAERAALLMNVEAFTRLRVIVNNNAAAATNPIYSRIAAITE